MSETLDRVPPHLRRFVVTQDLEAYSAVDHAVWRFVLLQMYDRLRHSAHAAYARGLGQTGMSVERIPRIADMDRCLSEFGWGAVCVDGFIPPRAFVEFQALGILPIAAEIRSVEHLPYTPAPDIIHEAAGHAPILPDAQYAAFLRRIGASGMRAFGSARDARMYDAIRALSLVKERRDATPDEIAGAERALAELVAQSEPPSEAAQLARLYWWTAEYGLVGSPHDYRLYGAGLLSSLAESHFCHAPEVQKLALTRACVEVDYDITRPQPQLFVASEFAQLDEVLEAVCAGFAFRRGGLAGLLVARDAGEVATLELECGLAVTGVVDEVIAEHGVPQFVRLRGACAASVGGRILEGHGPSAYPGGLSLVLAPLAGGHDAARLDSEAVLRHASGERADLHACFDCEGGLRIEGRLESALEGGAGRAHLLGAARATRGGSLLSQPDDGAKLLLAGGAVTSVRAGADDPRYWPEPVHRRTVAPARRAEDAQRRALQLLYERSAARSPEVLSEVHERLRREHPDEWLLRWNVLEALAQLGVEPERRTALAAELWQLEQRFAGRNPIAMGLRYLGHAEPV